VTAEVTAEPTTCVVSAPLVTAVVTAVVIEDVVSAPLVIAAPTVVPTAVSTEAPLVKDCWTEFVMAELTVEASPVVAAVVMLLVIVWDVTTSTGDVVAEVLLPTAPPTTVCVKALFTSNS
jgi:hypothetical protein